MKTVFHRVQLPSFGNVAMFVLHPIFSLVTFIGEIDSLPRHKGEEVRTASLGWLYVAGLVLGWAIPTFVFPPELKGLVSQYIFGASYSLGFGALALLIAGKLSGKGNWAAYVCFHAFSAMCIASACTWISV
jgi:hypothetical protein